MPPAYSFVLWCLVGLALVSLLHQIDLLIKDVKRERLEALKRKPVEAAEVVDTMDTGTPSPESLSQPL